MADMVAELYSENARDRRLLRAASRYTTRSPERLSEAIRGELSPEDAIARVKYLLNSADVYTELEVRRLVLIEIMENLDNLKTHRNNEKAWGPINRALQLLSNQIERNTLSIEDVNSKLAEDHARYFVEGFVAGFSRVIETLRERDEIVIEDDEVQELIQVGANASMGYIERVSDSGGLDDPE